MANTITVAAKTKRKKRAAKKTPGKNIGYASSYEKFKNYQGKQYTGMQVGRSHKWYYDKGIWRDRKITPDLWEITYSVIKRRAGEAPEGSGVPVGTGYHWFILSHQFVHKLDANDYSTNMVGIKFKLAHKRADKDKWNLSENAKRKHLVQMLKDFVSELEKEPEKTAIVPLQFSFKNKEYHGMAVPMLAVCKNGVCDDLDVTLNDKHLGIIRNTKNGWRMTDVKSQALVNAIGEQILLWYE